MKLKQVSVEVSGIEFSAGHFVSEEGKCESLHGHNYQVSARVIGDVNSLGMVLNFREIKQRLKRLCSHWDHRLLLPKRSQSIKSTQKDDRIEVITPDRRYDLPSGDIVLLDVIETTAEELAQVLGEELTRDLKSSFPNIRSIEVAIAESSTSQAQVTMEL